MDKTTAKASKDTETPVAGEETSPSPPGTVLNEPMGLLFRGMCTAIGDYQEIPIPKRGEKEARTLRMRTYQFTDGKTAFRVTDWDDEAQKSARFEFMKLYSIRVTDASTDKGTITISGEVVKG